MVRNRAMLLALLALAVPTLAFGGEEEGAMSELSVQASLGECGLANAAIVCQIDASWNSVEGADYYTVSVTRADGSVVDFGQAPGTARTLFVPYAGPGSYGIQVAAYGTPPGGGKAKLVARDESVSGAGGSAESAERSSASAKTSAAPADPEVGERDEADGSAGETSGSVGAETESAEATACEAPAQAQDLEAELAAEAAVDPAATEAERRRALEAAAAAAAAVAPDCP